MMDAAAIPWWIWPIALFVVSFAIGIVAVLAGVGGGVLFVPIVGSLLPVPPRLRARRGAALRPGRDALRRAAAPARRDGQPAPGDAARAGRLDRLVRRRARRPFARRRRGEHGARPPCRRHRRAHLALACRGCAERRGRPPRLVPAIAGRIPRPGRRRAHRLAHAPHASRPRRLRRHRLRRRHLRPRCGIRERAGAESPDVGAAQGGRGLERPADLRDQQLGRLGLPPPRRAAAARRRAVDPGRDARLAPRRETARQDARGGGAPAGHRRDVDRRRCGRLPREPAYGPESGPDRERTRAARDLRALARTASRRRASPSRSSPSSST